MSNHEIQVPDIGEYANVDVIEVHVAKGDKIELEQALITLETDKATMDIPASQEGVVDEILLNVGDKVSQGSAILKLAAGAKEDTAVQDKASAEPEQAAPAKTQSDTGSAALCDMLVPDIGEYDKVDVIEVHVQEGDTIAQEQAILTLETDKATMDIPAPFGGVIRKILVKEQDKVSKGDVMAQVETAESAPQKQESKPQAAAEVAQVEAPKEVAAPQPVAQKISEPLSSGDLADLNASPAVRRMARVCGVDLTKVQGTGRKNRITQEDVEAHIKSRLAQAPAAGAGDGGLGLLPDPSPDFEAFGAIESKPMERIKKISGAHLHRNWVKIPHITFYEEIDITELENFRKAQKAKAEKQGLKLTPVAFILKALQKTLADFPIFNSSLSADGGSIIYKKYFHIGVAVDTPRGLMVPVIRDVDQKGLLDLAKDLMHFATKAREGTIAASDMQGGCFTISSLGNLGTTGFSPIINMPEVGIIGISKAQIKPVYQGDQFVPRLMLPISLAVDHRVIDGAEAGRFIVQLKQYLSDIAQLLL